MEFSNQVRKYFYLKAARDRRPIGGTFELTPCCNMNCAMCYIRTTEGEMRKMGQLLTAAQWIDLGKQCVEQGMLFLLLTGGEPFLRKDFREIYTGLKKLGLVITINSNATLIDEQTVAWLREDAPAKVNVTLYGASNATYHRLCGHPTGYDAAVRGIELLQSAGILVGINASVTQYNLSDLPAIAAFGKERGLEVATATYMFPPVRKAGDRSEYPAVRLTAEESGIARARAEMLTFPHEELEYRLRCAHTGCLEMWDGEDCQRVADEKMGCMAGKASFWVTWDGTMTPCGMMNAPKTQPLTDGFYPAWQELTAMTEKLYLPPECGSCKKRQFCMICGALSTAETGRSDGKPEYLCRQTQSYLEEMESEYWRRFHEN
ncbi:MAG: radical SAM protein [Oscillospiraceae bacterium]|nr:radical SAM protein [Oscillospiraceae bacterium]